MAPAPARAQPAGTYGGFHLGALQLALPIDALREVVPRGALCALPSACTGVVGGIELRGVLLPVLDLHRLLGRAGAPGAAAPDEPDTPDCDDAQVTQAANVIVLAHEGRRLGLLADGVSGVFEGTCIEPALREAPPDAGDLFAGSVRRATDDRMLSVLSPGALARLEHLPVVDEAQDGACARTRAAPAADADDAGRYAMIFRCGRTALAIDAVAVAGTIADPPVLASALAMGSCRGVLEHGGQRIAAVDLAALCGLTAEAGAAPRQAFVLRIDDGAVGLLVDEVIEIVPVAARQIAPLPALRTTEAALFGGMLPSSILPLDLPARARIDGAGCLQFDVAALRALPELQSLAQTNTPCASVPTSALGGWSRRPGAAAGRSMLLYDAAGDMATPIEQIAEILPFPSIAQPESGSAIDGASTPASVGSPRLSRAAEAIEAAGILGLMTERGRSILVLDLVRILRGRAPADAPGAILVVQVGTDHVGFAVARLRAIEAAGWEPVLPALARRAPERTSSRLESILRSGILAVVGPHQDERLVPVLDLRALAEQLLPLQTPAAVAAALAAIERPGAPRPGRL